MINAEEYGKALFLLSNEEGTEDEIRADAECVFELIRLHPDYVKLLDTPALTKSERLASIDESMAKINVHLKSLIKMLAEKHSVYLLPKALSGFFKAYDEYRGIVEAEVISAVALTEGEISRLSSVLEKKTQKIIRLKNTVDPTILGGIKLRYMGLQLDSSLQSTLTAIEQGIKSTIV